MDPSDRVGVVTRMHASKLAIGGLLALGALAACRGRGSDAPAEDHTTRSRIRFVNPWFELPDGRSEQVIVRIDGRGIGDCWRKDRDTERVCTEAFVEPGPHVVRLVINYRDAQTLRLSASKYYASDNRIDVGVGEDIAFDLSGIEDREGDELLSRRSVNRTTSACLKRLDDLVAAPTCTSEDLDAMASRLGRARSACRSVPSRYEMQAQSLVWTVESNLHGLPMERCFVGDDLRKLPGMFGENRSGSWPRGTLQTGSWWWARDPRPKTEEEWSGDGRGPDLDVAQRLGKLEQQIPEIRQRLGMVEDLMDGYFAKARPAAAIDRALEDEFSLDPTTVAGHRLWHLTNRYWDEAYDPRLAAWLAEQAKRDTSKNCAVGDEALQLVSYWTQDDTLTAQEWGAVQAMVSRTPADERINSACMRAVDVRLRSEVSSLDRLRWMVAFDCSERRHPRLRAEAVRRLLTGREDKRVDPRQRQQVRKESIRCLGADE